MFGDGVRYEVDRVGVVAAASVLAGALKKAARVLGGIVAAVAIATVAFVTVFFFEDESNYYY